MSLKKILMKGTTRISLHERFTFLRHQNPAEPRQTVHVESVRQGLFRDQQASARNRRLAQMMDRRPTVMAALKLKKRIMKQRLGQVARPGLSVKDRLSIKDRLSLRGRGGIRGRVGQRGISTGRSPMTRQPRSRGSGTLRGGRISTRGSLSRSQSLNNLSRSQSMQSLSGRRYVNTGRGGGRFQNRNSFNRQEFRRGRGRGFRARGGSFNRNRDDFSTRRGGGYGRFNNRGQRTRGFRGRGGGRGGRGRGGKFPTKEELDSQLDQYMAGTKGVLDRELESYMNHQDESWD